MIKTVSYVFSAPVRDCLLSPRQGRFVPRPARPQSPEGDGEDLRSSRDRRACDSRCAVAALEGRGAKVPDQIVELTDRLVEAIDYPRCDR